MAEFKACHKFARISPRKARYVMDLVRNAPVEKALETKRRLAEESTVEQFTAE